MTLPPIITDQMNGAQARRATSGIIDDTIADLEQGLYPIGCVDTKDVLLKLRTVLCGYEPAHRKAGAD